MEKTNIASSNGFWTYKYFIDPLTRGLRKSISEQIEPGSNILDIACGTGSLLFELAPKIKSGIGIDLNGSKIDQAMNIARQKKADNITFMEGDASKLSSLFEYKFDYIVLSLAVHQFPEPLRYDILNQVLANTKHLIIADYTVPVPKSFSGLLSKSIEKIAGDEHYNAYLSFVKNRGIEGLMDKFSLERLSTSLAGYGVFTICKLRSIKN